MNENRFDVYLHQLHIEQLKDMAKFWQRNHFNQQKQQLVNLISYSLDTPDKIKASITQLLPYEKAALAIIKKYGNSTNGETLVLLLRLFGVTLPKDEVVHGRKVNRTITRLLERGVFMVRGKGYHHYYSYNDGEHLTFFSDERILAHIDAFTPEPFPLKPHSLSLPTTYRRPSAVNLDLINLLQAIETVQSFSLTKASKIRVSTLRQLRKLLGLKSDDLEMDGFHFKSYLPTLLNTCLGAGILTRSEDEATLTMSVSVDAFVTRSSEMQINQILNGYIQPVDFIEEQKEYIDIKLICLLRGRFMLYVMLTLLPTDSDGFFSIDAFQEEIYNRIGDYFSFATILYSPYSSFYNTQINREKWLAQEKPRIIHHLSTWLYYFGIVELQLKDNTPVGFRLTDLGRRLLHPDLEPLSEEAAEPISGPAWIIQPNFDVVVYLDRATAEQMIFLERHAEREQLQQHMAQYQLTQNSVYKGLESGTKIEDLLDVLETGAGKALPQNVTIDLQEWAKLRERVTLHHQANLLEFPDKATREQALRANVKGVPVGERFLLITNSRSSRIVSARRVDYTQPLPRCLSVNEEGLIKVSGGYCDFLLVAQLDKWAECKEERVWQVTQDTVTQALSGKVKIEELFALLEERLIVPRLPALLDVALNAWGRKPTELELANVTLIRSTDPKLFRAIFKSRKLKPYIQGVLGSNLLLVRKNKLAELQAHLDWAGIKITDELTLKKKV